MTHASLHDRHTVLLAQLRSLDGVEPGERQLVCDLVLRGGVPGYPWLVAHEWEVVPGRSQHGKGDLVLTDGAGRYAVIEVKRLEPFGSGRTAKRRRTRKRSDVRDQAHAYAERARAVFPDATQIRAGVYTDDPLGPGLRWLEPA